MISSALKLFETIGDIRDGFVEEADDMYFSRAKLKKTLKYGAIGIVASFSFAAAVWIYQANRSQRKNAA